MAFQESSSVPGEVGEEGDRLTKHKPEEREFEKIPSMLTRGENLNTLSGTERKKGGTACNNRCQIWKETTLPDLSLAKQPTN